MRYTASALSNCFRALIKSRPGWFGGSGNRWAWGICAAAALCTLAAAIPTLAEPPPSDVPLNLTIENATATYLVVSQADDDEEMENLRQFILWCIWRLGGNPMQLDPQWTPPIGY